MSAIGGWLRSLITPPVAGSLGKNMLADQLQAVLDRTKGEREVTASLKKHPGIVLDAFVRFGDRN